MLNIDIFDTVAGKQIFEQGLLEEARDNVVEALEVRFQKVPGDIIASVKAIDRREILKSLHRHAILSEKIEDFTQMLTETEH